MNCIIPYLHPQVKPIKYLNRASCGTQPACLNNITFSHFSVQMLFSKLTSLPALHLHADFFLTLSLSMWFPLRGIHTSFPLLSSWLTAIYHSSRLSLGETFSDILSGISILRDTYLENQGTRKQRSFCRTQLIGIYLSLGHVILEDWTCELLLFIVICVLVLNQE